MRHPDSPGTGISGIVARVDRLPGAIALSYVLEGDLDRIRLPLPGQARFVEGLWRHTCCEVFIACSGGGYHEFNLSPSGEWAAYQFARYREGAPLERGELDPRIAVRNAGKSLELEGLIRLDLLSGRHAGTRLSLALSAVIEHDDGALSYWALRHPSGKPDFHHPEAFALMLE